MRQLFSPDSVSSLALISAGEESKARFLTSRTHTHLAVLLAVLFATGIDPHPLNPRLLMQSTRTVSSALYYCTKLGYQA